MNILDKIRLLIIKRRVIYSYHSTNEKLEEINARYGLDLDEDDIDEAILTGKLIETFDN